MNIIAFNLLCLLQIGAAYGFSLWFFPRLLFSGHLRRKSLTYRFLFSVVVGNFYMVQILFLLGLPGWNNFVTVPVLAFGLAFAVYYVSNRRRVNALLAGERDRLLRLLGGNYGLRLYLRDSLRLGERLRRCFGWIGKRVLPHLPEGIFLLLISAVAVSYYSYQIFTLYGVGTSDVPVHEYWMNSLAEGKIFVAGVYPFGMHCMVNFLYSVYHVEIYTMLRCFGPIQSLLIFWMLYLMLRRLCKSRFTPFVGLLAFVLVPDVAAVVFQRYSWALPQEYGMLMVYPAVLFLWEYLETGKRSHLYLFGTAFSLTLSGHFYATIAAGLFCGAVAIAYLRQGFLKKRILPVLLSGLVGVVISVAPLGISMLAGNHMEASLNWALGVMEKGNNVKAETPLEEEPPESGGEVSAPAGSQAGPEGGAPAPGLLEKLRTAARGAKGLVQLYLYTDEKLIYAYGGCLAFVFLYCLVQLLRRNKNGRLQSWLSAGLYQMFLLLLLCASVFGLPSLMDVYRTAAFLGYAAPLGFAMAADGIYQLFSGPKALRTAANGLLAAAVLATGVGMEATGRVRDKAPIYLSQYNGAYLSMQSILDTFPKNKWTIVSTTTELQPVWNHGWHYETADFLAGQSEDTLVIPTQYVFFFVEKRPLEHFQVIYPGITQGYRYEEISREAAALPLDAPEGENETGLLGRTILMSKMYYYLEGFQKRYPNELQVYYEDDDFICYRLEQNEYQLYNFALS